MLSFARILCNNVRVYIIQVVRNRVYFRHENERTDCNLHGRVNYSAGSIIAAVGCDVCVASRRKVARVYLKSLVFARCRPATEMVQSHRQQAKTLQL